MIFITPTFADDISNVEPYGDVANNDAATNDPAAINDDGEEPKTPVYHLYDDVNLISSTKELYGDKPKSFIKTVFPQIEDIHQTLLNPRHLFCKKVCLLFQQTFLL